MTSVDINTKAIGLYRHPNPLNAPDGALMAADECVITRENVIDRRKGYSLCNTGLPSALPTQMFVSSGYLFTHINNQLYVKSQTTCNYTIIAGLTPLLYNINWIFANSTDLYVSDGEAIRRYNFSSQYLKTFAGIANAAGSANGIGSIARFNSPVGIWGDGTYLYVCDSGNYTIRRIEIATATVTTFAGTAGMNGSTDGVGAAARFYQPYGIWGDGTYLYVCDATSAYTIRRIEIATATVSTFAGSTGVAGAANGVGTAATFNEPNGIWGDGAYLYVTDIFNCTVRRIEIATATVTTFAGTAGMNGSTDGTGSAARFNNPSGIWGDGTYLYVCDAGRTIRRIEIATAAVSTLAGAAGVNGSTDGIGNAARFNQPVSLWGIGDSIYITDGITNNTIRKLDKTNIAVTTFLGQPGVFITQDGKNLNIIQGPT